MGLHVESSELSTVEDQVSAEPFHPLWSVRNVVSGWNNPFWFRVEES